MKCRAIENDMFLLEAELNWIEKWRRRNVFFSFSLFETRIEDREGRIGASMIQHVLFRSTGHRFWLFGEPKKRHFWERKREVKWEELARDEFHRDGAQKPHRLRTSRLFGTYDHQKICTFYARKSVGNLCNDADFLEPCTLDMNLGGFLFAFGHRDPEEECRKQKFRNGDGSKSHCEHFQSYQHYSISPFHHFPCWICVKVPPGTTWPLLAKLPTSFFFSELQTHCYKLLIKIKQFVHS